jgi:DNA-binding response OmpR family regulator
MNVPGNSNSKRSIDPRWGELPPLVDVLVITGESRVGWSLAQAFAADSAVQVRLDQAIGITDGVGRLRERVYDVVLVCHDDDTGLDAPSVLDAIHTASSDTQPILVLGMATDQEIAAQCFEAGADAYLCLRTTTTRALLWQIARARERHQLLLDNQRLQIAHRQRQDWERDEAERLVDQQKNLIDGPIDASRLPEALVAEYYELLRAYVVMGSGNLGATLDHWIERVALTGCPSTTLLSLHVRAVEQMLQGLGSRSARHVLNRADLLMIETLAGVAEYHRRALEEAAPPSIVRKFGS